MSTKKSKKYISYHAMGFYVLFPIDIPTTVDLIHKKKNIPSAVFYYQVTLLEIYFLL